MSLRTIAVLCAALAFPATRATATLVWTGNYDTVNLYQWLNVQCGGPAPTCPCSSLQFGTGACATFPDTSNPFSQTGGRFQLVSSTTRQGTGYALQVQLLDGDSFGGNVRNEVSSAADPNHAEIRWGEGDEIWYGWSTMFDPGFPTPGSVASPWVLFTQWHHANDDFSPPLSMALQTNGAGDFSVQLWATHTYGVDNVPLWQAPIARGQWHDFVVHVKWSSDSTGFVELYYGVNGAVPALQTLSPPNAYCQGQFNGTRCFGPTLFTGQNVYIKQGLYRNPALHGSMTVYHDAMKAGTTISDVSLPTVPEPLAPQGLVCGLTYLFPGSESTPGDHLAVDGRCDNNHTIIYNQSFTNSEVYPDYGGIGFATVMDGDSGFASGYGWSHQRWIGNRGIPADTNPSHSARFALPRGAICGLHHTFWSSNADDYVCMGYDPGKSFPIQQAHTRPDCVNGALPPSCSFPGCPDGWTARKAFDMSSGSGYWTWCEYQDPNGLSYTSSLLPFWGIACGLAHEDPSVGNTPFGGCQNVATGFPGSGPPRCPSGAAATSSWFDDGEPSGVGLGGCSVIGNAMPTHTDSCFSHSCNGFCGGFDGCGNPCGLPGSAWCQTAQQCALPPDCPACTPSNCANGCCDSSGACVVSESSSACGLNGVACFSCPAGTHCSGSSCVQDFDCSACECGCDASGSACARFPTCSRSLAGVCSHEQLSCVCTCGGCDCE
jgi:hypothetical protein